MIASWQESNGKPRQCVEKQRCYSADKGPYSQSYGLPSGQIWLWSWTIKKAEYQRIDAFELWHWRRLLKVLYRKKIKTVNLKGNQPWILVERTDAEAETPVFWSSDVNRWFIGKVPDFGKDWGQEEDRASEDEMAGWHHWCSEHQLGQRLGDGEGQRGLECCSPWGCEELDTTGQLNNTFCIRKTPLLFPAAICRIAQSFS